MKKILFILALLIGLNSFAQDDDFFWSYRHPQLYDTIKITNSPLETTILVGRFYTYSGDSLRFITPRGSFKIPSNSDIPFLVQSYIYNQEIGYVVVKHNDMHGVYNLGGNASILSDLSQIKTLKTFELPNGNVSDITIKLNSFTSNVILEKLQLQEPNIVAEVGSFNLSNNGKLQEVNIVNSSISSILLPSSPDLSDISIPENQSLTSITFGDLSPTTWRFYAYNSHFDQTNIDKILKYFVDSNRNPFALGTHGSDYINLCGTRNGYPSSTGYGYVSILTNRGWYVCVNNSSTTPIVSTDDPTMVSSTSATLGGNASSDGGAAITSRGVAYGTSSNPTIAGSHTTLGTGVGLFSSSVTGLSSNTTYHARAYATNSNGTSYGEDKVFTTTNAIQTVPELITTAPTAITTTTTQSGGIITFDGNYEIVAKGVCWSTSSNPTIAGSHTTDGSGTDSFTSSITGLSANTKYYLRAYATNKRDAGSSYVYATGYGQEEEFTTASDAACNLPTVTTNAVNSITTNSAIGGGNATSDGGCNTTIKGSCWSTSMNPTTSDPHTTDGSGLGAFSSYISPLYSGTQYVTRAYAINSSGTSYGSNVSFTTAIPSTAQNYGYLYTWYSAMGDINGNGISETSIANTGWHVATKTEYETLINYVGISTAGNSLKLNGTTLWSASNTGTNLSLFSATGGGYRVPSGEFYDLQNRATIWTSTGYDSTNAWFLGLIVDSPTASLVFSDKNYGHAIRLIRDSTPLVNGQYGWYIGNDGQTYLTFCIGTQEWIISDLKESKFRNGTVIPEVQSGWYYLNYAAKCYYVP